MTLQEQIEILERYASGAEAMNKISPAIAMIASLKRLQAIEQQKPIVYLSEHCIDWLKDRAENLHAQVEIRGHSYPFDKDTSPIYALPVAPTVKESLTTEYIDKHLDAVLRASGSGLRYYSMQKTLDDMRAAMREVMTS